jgi:hypothetical protein
LPSPLRDTVRPAVSAAADTPRSARRRAARKLRMTLSEAATVTTTIARVSTGRRVGGRCVAKTQANRRKATCKRSPPVTGTRRTRAAAAGTGVAPLATTANGRQLRAGSYRVTVTARDAAGNASRAVTVEFRITS